MIRFANVQGDVVVDDKGNAYTQMAKTGLELDESGTYLIVTSDNGRTEVSCKAGRLSLGPSNYVLFKRGQGTFGFDQEAARVKTSMKVVLGRLWLRITRALGAPDSAPAPPGRASGPGVRG